MKKFVVLVLLSPASLPQLHPVIVGSMGLRAAVSADWANEGGIDCELGAPPEREL